MDNKPHDKKFYIKPNSPVTPKVINKLAEAIIAWAMKCKEDYQKRQSK
jgi:hypothetical protein